MKDLNKIPRRNILQKNTIAELAIRKAISLVEELEAHPELTNIVMLLDEARNRLADFEDTYKI